METVRVNNFEFATMHEKESVNTNSITIHTDFELISAPIILCLGQTGSGKSSISNAILNTSIFEESDKLYSVTNAIMASGDWNGTNIGVSVLDTPGFYSSNQGNYLTNFTSFLEAIPQDKLGIIVITLPLIEQRIKETYFTMLSIIQYLIDEDLWQKTIFVTTQENQINVSKEDIQKRKDSWRNWLKEKLKITPNICNFEYGNIQSLNPILNFYKQCEPFSRILNYEKLSIVENMDLLKSVEERIENINYLDGFKIEELEKYEVSWETIFTFLKDNWNDGIETVTSPIISSHFPNHAKDVTVIPLKSFKEEQSNLARIMKCLVESKTKKIIFVFDGDDGLKKECKWGRDQFLTIFQNNYFFMGSESHFEKLRILDAKRMKSESLFLSSFDRFTLLMDKSDVYHLDGLVKQFADVGHCVELIIIFSIQISYSERRKILRYLSDVVRKSRFDKIWTSQGIVWEADKTLKLMENLNIPKFNIEEQCSEAGLQKVTDLNTFTIPEEECIHVSPNIREKGIQLLSGLEIQNPIKLEESIFKATSFSLDEYQSALLHTHLTLKRESNLGKRSRTDFINSIPLQGYPDSKKMCTDIIFQYYYSVPNSPLISAIQGNKAAQIVKCDAQTNQKFEEYYRSSNRIFTHSHPQFDDEITINLENSTIKYKNRVLKAITRVINFRDEVIEIPPFFNDIQESPIMKFQLSKTYQYGRTVDSDMAEYIMEMMNKSFQNVIVNEITQIQNFYQLLNYNHESNTISQQSDNLIPKLCFIGTGVRDPTEFAEDRYGIPLNLPHKDVNQHCGGIGLSLDPRFADEIAYQMPGVSENRKRIIFGLVLTGNEIQLSSSPSLKRPPVFKTCNHMDVLYDSVVSDYKSASFNSKVYTVYKSSQVLPCFVVDYTLQN